MKEGLKRIILAGMIALILTIILYVLTSWVYGKMHYLYNFGIIGNMVVVSLGWGIVYLFIKKLLKFEFGKTNKEVFSTIVKIWMYVFSCVGAPTCGF
ncbi:hypothetical protein HY992_02895 [Candidatus Micrarchaeota archaeon]|nr:hypothetical protein [Candidatus Micrarchaeota archaeon]